MGLLFGLGCSFAVVAYVQQGQAAGDPAPKPAAAGSAVPYRPLATHPATQPEPVPGVAEPPLHIGPAADRRGSYFRDLIERHHKGEIRCVAGKLYWIHKEGGVTVIEPYPPDPADCHAS
ncbi:MAG: hypothetical protein ABFC67_02495 [Mizugakiibacter sp.]|uniref:hypothetical protein n=1 Tax=Mizugakiibacter sp. TaxID=1972610 RepID=UPI0031C9D572|nr:hypothetical protein [Xanthomonadaceae bacterium]